MSDRLLIGTARRLLLWDGQPHTVYESDSLTYGITWDGRHAYVVNGPDLLVMDKDLEVVDRLALDMWGPHQALYSSGRVYIMESARNTIITVAGRAYHRQRWPHMMPGEDPHINSLWVQGDKHYVVEHRQMVTPKRIVVTDRDWTMLHVIEIPESALMGKLSGLHNVYVEDDTLYTLGPGVIVTHNLVTGEFRTVTPDGEFPMYLRGLARTQDRFYIGVSHHQPRDRRVEGGSAFLVMDSNLNQLELVSLEGTGQLCEIRALEGDRAHNGINFKVSV